MSTPDIFYCHFLGDITGLFFQVLTMSYFYQWQQGYQSIGFKDKSEYITLINSLLLKESMSPCKVLCGLQCSSLLSLVMSYLFLFSHLNSCSAQLGIVFIHCLKMNTVLALEPPIFCCSSFFHLTYYTLQDGLEQNSYLFLCSNIRLKSCLGED